MFAGVELSSCAQPPAQLEPLQFELKRYLKHLHIGPYEALPAKWRSLKILLDERGETIGLPSLEVYGHHCEDASQQETTILIALQSKSA
jgi:effector-binding domain-containing protein